MLGVVGVLLHSGSQLFHAGGCFLQRRCLRFRALAQVGIARRNLFGCAGDACAAVEYLVDDLRQAAVHVTQGREQVARLVLALHLDATAQITARHRPGDIHSGADRLRDRARDDDARNHGQQHRADRQAGQQIALHDVLRLIRLHELFLALVRVRGIRVGGLDEGGQQRAALVVHLLDGFVVFAGKCQPDDVGRHGAVLGFHAIDVFHQRTGAVVGVLGAGNHVVELLELALHIVVRPKDVSLLQIQVFLRDHEDQVACGDGAPIHRRAHVVGDVRAGADAVHVVREPFRRFGERPQRHA